MEQTPAALLTGEPGEPWRPIAVLTTGYGHGERQRGLEAAVTLA